MKLISVLLILLCVNAYSSEIQVNYLSPSIYTNKKFIHKVGPVIYPIKNYCIKNKIDLLKQRVDELASGYKAEVFITDDGKYTEYSLCGPLQASVSLSYTSETKKGFSQRIFGLDKLEDLQKAVTDTKVEADLISKSLKNIEVSEDQQYFYMNNTNSFISLEKTSTDIYDVYFEKISNTETCEDSNKIQRYLTKNNKCREKIKSFYQVKCNSINNTRRCSRTDPYVYKKSQDIIFTSTGAALVGISYFLGLNKPHMTPQDVMNLNTNDIPAFERFVSKNWNPKLAKASDIILMASFALPLTILINSKYFKKSLPKYGLMYLETLLLTAGVTNIVKNTVNRARPYTYNPSAPLNKKLEQDALKSFISGHSAFAFATSIFFAKIFNDTYPNSKLRPYVWGSAIVLASTVAAFRVAAGKHFLTDVLVGAIVGASIGYLVPKLHLKKGRKLYIYPQVGKNYQGIGIILKL
jgi:membrane-associated phospholipid phosphatase